MKITPIFALLMTLVVGSRAAEAQLSAYCEFRSSDTIPDPVGDYPWHEPQTIVPVYTASDQPPWDAAQMSQADFEYQLERALAVMNEQLGSTLRLRYVGPVVTPNFGFVPGAILILGDSSGCKNGIDYAQIFSGTKPNGHHGWGAGNVVINRYLGCPAGDPANQINYVSLESEPPASGVVDIEYILFHELGHAAYGSDHPDSTTNSVDNGGNCDDFQQYSWMRSGYGDRPPAWRTAKDYDAEVAQHWFGSRGGVAQIYKKYYIPTNMWSAPSTAFNIAAAYPIFRMGSMTQQANKRILAWIGNYQSPEPLPGGGGQVEVAIYDGPATQGASAFSTVNGQRRPVAVANKPGTSEVLLVVQDYAGAGQTPYVGGSDLMQTCFFRSVDFGETWIDRTCDFSHVTRRYGLSAAYDPLSDSFLVGYVADSYVGTQNPEQCLNDGRCGQDDIPYVAVLTIPALGSSTPFAATSTVGTSLEAPSIACSGAVNGCRIVYDDYFTGDLLWFVAGVDPSTGVVNTTAAYIQGYLQFDTPDIAYNPPDDSFKLASTTNNDAIYSYSMSSSETAWTGTGDIWNDPSSFISAGVVSIRRFADNTTWATYTWWLRFI